MRRHGNLPEVVSRVTITHRIGQCATTDSHRSFETTATGCDGSQGVSVCSQGLERNPLGYSLGYSWLRI